MTKLAPSYKVGSRVKVLSNNKEAKITEYIINSWGDELCGGKKLLAVLHYINDPDPHAICFLGKDKFELVVI